MSHPVYLAAHIDDRGPLVALPHYGFWNNYFVYEVASDLLPRLELRRHHVVVVPVDVVGGWKFAGILRDHIKVHPETGGQALEQIGRDNPNIVKYKPNKDKYMLQPEDHRLGLEFGKLIARADAARRYEQHWNVHRPLVSTVYLESDDSALHPDVVLQKQLYYAELHEVAARLRRVEQLIDSANDASELLHALLELELDTNPDNHVRVTGETDVQHTAQPQAERG